MVTRVRHKSECPRGTVATLGHPGNVILIVKGRDGWRYVDTGELVDYDSLHKSQWDVYQLPAIP